MKQVICDICNTSYPEEAGQCPICGYVPGAEITPLTEDEDFVFDESWLNDLSEETAAEENEEVSAVPVVPVQEVAAKVENTDEDEDDDEDHDEEDDSDDEEDEDDDDDDEDERRPSGFLIAALVVVIIALLAVNGYILVRYFLPGLRPEATEPSIAETTAPIVETVDSNVPCAGLVMTSDSEVLLEQAGNSWLINVVAMPEDTTDEIIFLSNNLDIATVDADGIVTAVGEGSAVISVICGDYTVECNVTCAFVDEPSVPDETGTEPTAEEGTEPATEDATEAPTEAASDVKFALNKSDITFNRIGVLYKLKVSGGIDPKDVEWSSSNGGICRVDDGVLSILAPGVAKITAKYQGQEATCIVRVVVNKG